MTFKSLIDTVINALYDSAVRMGCGYAGISYEEPFDTSTTTTNTESTLGSV